MATYPDNGVLRAQYPGLFYHKVTDPVVVIAMEELRSHYLWLANSILAFCPGDREQPGARYRSLALTALEESCRLAIQSLAVGDLTTLQVPPGYPWGP